MQPDGCMYAGDVTDTVQDPELSETELGETELSETELSDAQLAGTESGPPPEAVVRVEIDAAPDDVWHALTTDDGLAGWLGDGSTIGDDVGGEIDVHDLVTGQRKRGVLDEFTPGHRLGYTWWPETTPGDATRVAISIEPTHTGTRVTVVESRPLAPTAPLVGPTRVMASTQLSCDWAWRAALLTIMATQSTRLLVVAGTKRGAYGR